MPDIKIGTTSIINLERGSTDINFVYRGTTLVWQRTTPPTNNDIINFYTTVSLNFLTSTETKYSTKVNVKL